MNTPSQTTQAKPLLPLEALEQAAECLRVLAHPHRLRMVQMVLRGKYSVGELAEACNVPSNVASEHLRLLQRCGFLSSERSGRTIYYQVAEPHLIQILACIEDRFGQQTSAETVSSPAAS